MKSESLVIADQHVAVNTFPGLVQNKCAWQFIRLGGENPSIRFRTADIGKDRTRSVRKCLKDLEQMVVLAEKGVVTYACTIRKQHTVKPAGNVRNSLINDPGISCC